MSASVHVQVVLTSRRLDVCNWSPREKPGMERYPWGSSADSWYKTVWHHQKRKYKEKRTKDWALGHSTIDMLGEVASRERGKPRAWSPGNQIKELYQGEGHGWLCQCRSLVVPVRAKNHLGVKHHGAYWWPGPQAEIRGSGYNGLTAVAWRGHGRRRRTRNYNRCNSI